MAEHRHKRDTDARRFTRPITRWGTAGKLSAGIALTATGSVVALGVLGATPVTAGLVAADVTTPLSATVGPDVSDRFVVSRSASRKVSAKEKRALVKEARADGDLAATAEAVARAKKKGTRLWTTAPLNLWTLSGQDARQVGEIPATRKVLVTGRQAGERVEIVVDGRSRWVTDGYLAEEKPTPGIGGACTNGTAVSGVSASIAKVHQAVCSAFPSITVYGTLRGGGGDHPLGRAVDIMVGPDLGWQVAELVRENASALGVSYVIYSQRIWSVQRSGEGWRSMPDRGSPTANHYDHVHVSVY